MDGSRRNFTVLLAPGIKLTDRIMKLQGQLYHAILEQCCKQCLGDRWVNDKGKPPKHGESIKTCPSCHGTGLTPCSEGHRRDQGFDAVDMMERRRGLDDRVRWSELECGDDDPADVEGRIKDYD